VECKRLGLKASGSTADLKKRLRDHTPTSKSQEKNKESKRRGLKASKSTADLKKRSRDHTPTSKSQEKNKECKRRGLKASGSSAALRTRLREHIPTLKSQEKNKEETQSKNCKTRALAIVVSSDDDDNDDEIVCTSASPSKTKQQAGTSSSTTEKVRKAVSIPDNECRRTKRSKTSNSKTNLNQIPNSNSHLKLESNHKNTSMARHVIMTPPTSTATSSSTSTSPTSNFYKNQQLYQQQQETPIVPMKISTHEHADIELLAAQVLCHIHTSPGMYRPPVQQQLQQQPFERYQMPPSQQHHQQQQLQQGYPAYFVHQQRQSGLVSWTQTYSSPLSTFI